MKDAPHHSTVLAEGNEVSRSTACWNRLERLGLGIVNLCGRRSTEVNRRMGGDQVGAESAAPALGFMEWRPESGRVLRTRIAVAVGAAVIDKARTWITPAFGLAAVHDGSRGAFLHRDALAPFLAAHQGAELIFHGAPRDLEVIDVSCPDAGIYDAVERGQIQCTELMHRLLYIANTGRSEDDESNWALERCTSRHLKVALPTDDVDADGDAVCDSFGKTTGLKFREVDQAFLGYLSQRAVALYNLHKVLTEKIVSILRSSSDAFGALSQENLDGQITQWGILTHHIQLRGAVALRRVTARGMTFDSQRADEIRDHLSQAKDLCLQTLAASGYFPGQKHASKALQEILRELSFKYKGVDSAAGIKRKDDGNDGLLSSLTGVDPFVDALHTYRSLENLDRLLVAGSGRAISHPQFDVLKATGRTSSFGEFCSQNLPRAPEIRRCIVPSDAHVFGCLDYTTVELVTLSQALLKQFELQSKMADAINDGKDLHKLVAAKFLGKPENEISSEERAKAKPINFGKPGGMGSQTLRQYAKTTFGVELSDQDLEAFSNVWFNLFPEMVSFLDWKVDIGGGVARMFGLTPRAFADETNSPSFLEHPKMRGAPDSPCGLLGGMCLKVAKLQAPVKKNGEAYTALEKEFFWKQMAKNLRLLDPHLRRLVVRKQASERLSKAIAAIASRQGVFTLTGRLRGNVGYCARLNTIFQGLAADGAKIALWRLWRAGFKVVNFVHDEFLIELRADGTEEVMLQRAREIMIASMREVVSDVKVQVKAELRTTWAVEDAVVSAVR